MVLLYIFYFRFMFRCLFFHILTFRNIWFDFFDFCSISPKLVIITPKYFKDISSSIGVSHWTYIVVVYVFGFSSCYEHVVLVFHSKKFADFSADRFHFQQRGCHHHHHNEGSETSHSITFAVLTFYHLIHHKIEWTGLIFTAFFFVGISTSAPELPQYLNYKENTLFTNLNVIFFLDYKVNMIGLWIK